MINTGALRGLAMSIGIAVLVSRVDLQFDAVLPGNNIRLILSFMVYFGISTIVYRFFTAKNNLVWRLALAWVFTVVAFVGSCLHPVNSEMPIRRIADVLDSKACRDWIDIAEAQAVSGATVLWFFHSVLLRPLPRLTLNDLFRVSSRLEGGKLADSGRASVRGVDAQCEFQDGL
jgi:hypothetical protein